jgi:signal transduction histidine kinase
VDILRFSKTEYWRGLQKGEWTPFRFITIYLSIGLFLITFEQIFFIQGYFFSYGNIVSIALHLLYLIGGITFFNWCLKKLGRQANEESERKSLELLQASEKLVIAGRQVHEESERKSLELLQASEKLVIAGRQAHEESERKSLELLQASEKLVIVGRQAHEESERKSLELLQASEKLVIAGQMAAGIAHEIRNPLTSLKGFLKLMQTGPGGKKEYFDIMYSELDRIELILSELLLLAKPQHEMSFQKKELLNLLQQIIVLLEPQANLNNVQLMTRSLSDQLYINASENHLKQVFINIIKNAIEAMPNGGEILIEVKQNNGQVRVSIIDQGFGIPEEHLTKLGEPFFSTKQTGTGLGLAITHQIVENHGGRIKISSKLGEGTVFDVMLPLAQ